MTNWYIANLRTGGDNHELDEEDLAGLGAIGRSLHASLIPGPEHELYSQSSEVFAGLQSIKDLERQDDTPLRHFYHAIATGEKCVLAEGHRKTEGAYTQR